MSAIARTLQHEHGDVDATLRTITAAAVDAVPGTEAASISYVTGRRKVESRAWSGSFAHEVDDAQDRFAEGPCLDAIWERRTVVIRDMAAEKRWPRFGAVAVALGVRSSLSFQLFIDGDTLGALNLYSREPDAFGEDATDVGKVLASHAAVALSGAQTEDNLRRAMGTRDVLGQAKGILMERYKITADQAFQLLARTSQQTNRKLVEVAVELSQTGSMPGSDRPGG
jgi:transcriptional regulator with GAF, ATPase, and Fis domain